MTEQTLVDRYVAAVVGGVPAGQRGDVAAELRTSLADAIEDLQADGLPLAQAEEKAVQSLGDPMLLAAQFSGRPRHLIGPAFYAQYVQLLRTLLVIVVPIVGALVMLAQGLAGDNPFEVVLGSLGAMFQVGVQVAFWVTVSFALVERSGAVARPTSWTPADLPRVVDRRIGLADTVVSIAALTVLIWALLWQRTHWLVTAADGSEVPVLDPDLWDLWLPVMLVILVASILLEVAKYHTGRWTIALAAVNTVLNAAFAGIVMWLASTDDLLNPAVAEILPEGIPGLLATLPWIIVVIAVIDTVSGWRNALRSWDDGRGW